MASFSFEIDFHSDGFGPIYLFANHVRSGGRWIQVVENALIVQQFIICLSPAPAKQPFYYTLGKPTISH